MTGAAAVNGVNVTGAVLSDVASGSKVGQASTFLASDPACATTAAADGSHAHAE